MEEAEPAVGALSAAQRWCPLGLGFMAPVATLPGLVRRWSQAHFHRIGHILTGWGRACSRGQSWGLQLQSRENEVRRWQGLVHPGEPDPGRMKSKEDGHMQA